MNMNKLMYLNKDDIFWVTGILKAMTCICYSMKKKKKYTAI